MKATVEKKKLTAIKDKGVEEKWGDTIYRINFKAIAPKTSDKMNFVIGTK